jgi:hypothetical protein
MKIIVEQIEFVDRDGETCAGTAFFATVETIGAGPTLAGVGVHYRVGGRVATVVVPTHALSHDSYLRVCAAAGVDP